MTPPLAPFQPLKPETVICTAAIGLISTGCAVIAQGTLGGHLEPLQVALSAVGIILGAGLVEFAHCLPR